MSKWNRCAAGWTVCLLTGCLASCAPVHIKNNAALCTVRFDVTDPALADLSLANLRAVAAFEAACGRTKLP